MYKNETKFPPKFPLSAWPKNHIRKKKQRNGK